MGQNAKSKRIPHDDVTFLTTRSDEPVFVRVHERIDAFLVQVECFVLVYEFVDVVNVDQAVKR
jgi:hypothetical protein